MPTDIAFKIGYIKDITRNAKGYQGLLRLQNYSAADSMNIKTAVQYREKQILKLRKELIDNFYTYSAEDQAQILAYLLNINE